jgi:hypothetical protein
MKIEIDDEFGDEILRGALMETYLNLSENLKNDTKADDDDKEIWTEVVAAIEVLGKWYFYDFNGKVKEAKKARKKK